MKAPTSWRDHAVLATDQAASLEDTVRLLRGGIHEASQLLHDGLVMDAQRLLARLHTETA